MDKKYRDKSKKTDGHPIDLLKILKQNYIDITKDHSGKRTEKITNEIHDLIHRCIE